MMGGGPLVWLTARFAVCPSTPSRVPSSPPPLPTQVVERAREAREELATFRQQQAEGPDGEDGELASPAKRRAAKRRASKQAERLELAAADNLSQVWSGTGAFQALSAGTGSTYVAPGGRAMGL